ncbi:hypothetical protein Q8A67_004854 [Cirrhinus molitorella]|uniref:Uncharacterized protein n=1 Tax=Cirrhinus molitorella TaxID=172907 RepID=A0AA88TV79_9TELE|nr:hypothetical protein Q8A67_004854 [Cirrhinus molitorella]
MHRFSERRRGGSMWPSRLPAQIRSGYGALATPHWEEGCGFAFEVALGARVGLCIKFCLRSHLKIHSLNCCQGDGALTYRGRGGIDPCQSAFAAFDTSAVAFHSAAVSQVSSRLSSSLRRSFVSPPPVRPHFPSVSPSLHP